MYNKYLRSWKGTYFGFVGIKTDIIFPITSLLRSEMILKMLNTITESCYTFNQESNAHTYLYLMRSRIYLYR